MGNLIYNALRVYLINLFTILPINSALDIYAKEKADLRNAGTIIDDFDLLIGSTAIKFDMIMVTNNTKHLGRIYGIQIQDWTRVQNLEELPPIEGDAPSSS